MYWGGPVENSEKNSSEDRQFVGDFFLPIISCILNAYSRFFRELNSCAYSIASKLSNNTKYAPIGIMSRKDSPLSIFNSGQHSSIILLLFRHNNKTF